MEAELILSLEGEASSEDLETVHAGLRRFNRAYAGESNHTPLHLFLRTPEGQVVGGCFGETGWQWLFVKILWVAEEFRGQGYGRRLLEAAEEEARSRGCREVYLDTFEFQAKGVFPSCHRPLYLVVWPQPMRPVSPLPIRQLTPALTPFSRKGGCEDGIHYILWSVARREYPLQAKPFYDRSGYHVFGVLEGYPPGFSRYYLRKQLSLESASFA